MADQMSEGPIHLIEDEDTGDRFLVYASNKGIQLDIKFEGETLWMTQAQMAEMFGRDRTSITKHILNIIEEGELDEETCVKKVHTSYGRPASIYSLDMVISVGYRVSSAQATLFRRWATGILVQYAKKGFVIDAVRLKNPENADRIAELREIIRDIRSDEANVYRELRRICAMCQDYDGSSSAALDFFQRTQAKLVYAVTSHTPSEIVATRADHEDENMGLQSWANDNIRKSDVTVSKNYLVEGEIRELNRLTTILLDIFEDQLSVGRLVMMSDARELLDRQLAQLGRSVLTAGGSVSTEAAKNKAHGEYAKWNVERKAQRHRVADESIAALAKEAKKLPRR
ncbi:RhuM family protein [Acidimangrovimonas pyrenivorans]|uniref:RhuM family protein n=1 Tax=Acidimangrovimonas pyrenivorans TaxID=2030798 RepID=A0ABV7ADI9_9RHOB